METLDGTLCIHFFEERLRLFLRRQTHGYIKWELHMSRRKSRCQIVLIIYRFNSLCFKCLRWFLFSVWILMDIAPHIIEASEIWNTFERFISEILLYIQSLDSEISIFPRKAHLRDMRISEEIILS